MTEYRANPVDVAAVLRIIGGRLAGKEYPLARDRRICIGHGFGNDVVLRGAGTRDGSIELRLADDAVSLRVLAGSMELLGRTLEQDDDAVLPPYLPFRFGEHLLAYGDRGSARWEEAASIANGACVAPITPLPPPRLQDRVQTVGRTLAARAAERISVFHVALATAAVVLLGVAAGPTSALIEDQFGGAQQLERAYHQAGLRGVSVSKNPVGGLIVSGSVEQEADLMRVRAIADQASGPVMVDVGSSASLANAATDILTAQGIDARALPSGLGGIAIEAPFLPADKQDSLRQLLVRDLPGLRRVSFRVDDTRGGDPLQSMFANSSTGLATVIQDPAHIATADGSRWFPGAILPTGHRLVAIEPDRVRFEKAGRVEELKF